MSDARLEDCGGSGDAGADAGLEVTTHPGGDSRRTTICLEALQVEAEVLGALPEMRVVGVSAVDVQRVDHREELPLQPSCLCRGVQSR